MSKKIMYAVFLSFLISSMVWSRIIRWSQVAFPGMPPAWASVSWTSFLTLSLMILSNTFPGLLASVIPLSFEHFPLVPFLLYSLRIWPSCQLFGISSFTWILLNASLKIFLVFLLASMNVSLGMSSGPRLFFLFLFSFLWLFLAPWGLFVLVLLLFVQLIGVLFFLLLFRCILSNSHILGFLVLLGIGLQSILLCVLLFSQGL